MGGVCCILKTEARDDGASDTVYEVLRIIIAVEGVPLGVGPT